MAEYARIQRLYRTATRGGLAFEVRCVEPTLDSQLKSVSPGYLRDLKTVADDLWQQLDSAIP